MTLELLCLLNERDSFQEGIVYVDMEGVDTVEAFKERLRIKLICSGNDGEDTGDGGEMAQKQCNQLLVIENVDSLLPFKTEISSNIINFISIYN